MLTFFPMVVQLQLNYLVAFFYRNSSSSNYTSSLGLFKEMSNKPYFNLDCRGGKYQYSIGFVQNEMDKWQLMSYLNIRSKDLLCGGCTCQSLLPS